MTIAVESASGGRVQRTDVAGWFTMPTPFGACTVVWCEDTVLGCGFTESLDALTRLIHASLRPTEPIPDRNDAIAAAIEAYCEGELRALDEVSVLQRSTPQREAAWTTLREVGPGTTVSYGELARRMGSPRGARAAGQVCARNAVSLFIPCHRVVAASGGVNHYAWGAATKSALLNHERLAMHLERR